MLDLRKPLTKHDGAAPLLCVGVHPPPLEWKWNYNARQMHKLMFSTILLRILGGSCNNEWILEETGNETNNDNDIASCMETDDDEMGKDVLLHAFVGLWPVNGQSEDAL